MLIYEPLLFAQKHLHKEKYYQKIACRKLSGSMEYRLRHRERVDCYTTKLACEVDFAYMKEYEAIGQSLFYGLETKRQPCIILIKEKYKDFKYIRRVVKVSKSYGIRLYIIDEKGNMALLVR